ncbi:MAG TPA: hypothetical protein VGE97_07300 [Nitrososphaera sp.]|jgi:hypothetical protein
MSQAKSPLRLSLSGIEDDEGGSFSTGTLGIVTGKEIIPKSLTVAISGTRKGMTAPQEVQLRKIFMRLRKKYGQITLLHGDCFGVDEQTHKIAREFNFAVRIYPPMNDRQRAYCKGDELMPVQTYSVRNNNMVRDSDYVICVPASKAEQMRGSGTWMTYRYAKRIRRPYTLLFPDGGKIGFNWQQFLYPD